MMLRRSAALTAALFLAGTLAPAAAEAAPAHAAALSLAPAAVTASAAQRNVHPGAFCAPQGATGYTKKGTKMRCTKKRGDNRARWRAA